MGLGHVFQPRERRFRFTTRTNKNVLIDGEFFIAEKSELPKLSFQIEIVNLIMIGMSSTHLLRQ